MSDTKPYGPDDRFPMPRAPSRNVVADLDRIEATVEALVAARAEVSRLEKYGDSVKSIGDNLALDRDKWKTMAEDFIKLAEDAWEEAGKAVSMQAFGWLEDLTKKMRALRDRK